jgi:uncharacterized membrane protein (GlpM family)
MILFIVKTIISALLIVLISEISKKYSFIGAALASVPLVSFLSFIWIYLETKNIEKISSMSKSIFWLVIPSLIFFIAFPFLLDKKVGFSLSMVISATLMIVCYFILLCILKLFNVTL